MSSYMDIIGSHIRPFVFLYSSLTFLPGALFGRRDSPSLSARDAWFFSFWAKVGPLIREGASAHITALLQGRGSRGGVVAGEPVHAALGGTVLEIGAGTGVWADLLASQPGVERVFGIEPNEGSVRILERVVRERGIGDKYTVVPAGIEDAGEWVGRGEVDCVVTLLCMCSVPDPERIAREVYGYLKPGGRWYVFEHVRADGVGWWTRCFQGFLNIFWPTMIGGCQLTRPTGESLRKAGPWSKIDLERRPEDPWYAPLPHIYGVLTK
ncbi:uncharacterized protein DNG_01211 [Cephalotrichum gorgonifer]|uniref:Methyltransf_11 domain-containing protein n=1 Tax=Cephalotrichum gorgonifer TaxID=2041049 RepID=A0AAE8MS74_9PEZI|nr:uncharacterized protein DNG_01211 [Cephalotrichum gorgonifer]